MTNDSHSQENNFKQLSEIPVDSNSHVLVFEIPPKTQNNQNQNKTNEGKTNEEKAKDDDIIVIKASNVQNKFNLDIPNSSKCCIII